MKDLTSLIKIIVLSIAFALVAGCSNQNSERSTITISAAASLTAFLDEIIFSFEEEHTNVEVLVNYGSSGSLQKQIEQGAPTDLFISAGKKQIERLTEQHLLVNASTIALLTNTLVVVEPLKEEKMPNTEMASIEHIFAAKQPEFIAMGETDTVPAGIYAKQALEHEAMWETWKDSYVFGKDVREVLAYVEQGNADFGIVYQSDALSSDKVSITYHIPSSWHEPISYIGSVVAYSEKQELANLLLKYLQDDKWITLYEQNGFKRAE